VLELKKENEMKRIPSKNPVLMMLVLIMTGWCIFPVTALVCDGPPQSQSFILFNGGCDQSRPDLPCVQGFMFPAQPSAGGDFPAQYALDFGDGSPPYYGTVDGVTHTYNRPGIFTLKFMAGTQCDRWRSGSFVLNIPAPLNFSPAIPECVPVYPSAGFTGRPISGAAPLTVQFTSTSRGANAYGWNFGDGGTSPAQNPRHTYTVPGIYSVDLDARDSCSGNTDRAGMSNFVTVTSPVTTLSITSNPSGAAVFIDYIIQGITPLMLTDTAIGNHRITITLDGYDEYTRNILLESAGSSAISAELKKSIPQTTTLPPSNGTITITTIPPGASVTVDGIQNGVAPLVIPGLLPGTHGVTLSSDGYEDWNYMVSVRPGQTSEINAVLVAKKENTGSLAVITEPPGAEISVDGIFKGVSPVTITGLAPTTHTVLITLGGYTNATTNISITPLQTQKYTLDLQKNYTPSSTDLLLAGGVIVMIAVIAIVVMVKKDPKKK
jgi:PKD repeat protein